MAMPLTSSLFLIVLGGETAEAHDKDYLFRLSDEAQRITRMSIAYAARSSIFAEEEFEKQTEDKTQDEAVQREECNTVMQHSCQHILLS